MASAMGLAKRFLGVYLIAVAVAVFVNWIATPLYHDGSSHYTVWEILNWFMAVAVVLALAVNLCRKICGGRSEPNGPLTSRQVDTNLSFYGSLVLTAWFLWNWFHSFLPENEPALVGDIHLAAWMWINPLFYIVCGVTGLNLLREARRA